MSARQMGERCPGAQSLGRAVVAGYRLAFDRRSEGRWGGHVADLKAEAGEEAWGVLWQVTDDHLLALDHYEGVAEGAYRRALIVTVGAQGSTTAVAYLVVSPEDEGRPSPAYLDVILAGAREHDLPAAYIAKLEAFASPNIAT